MNVEVICTTDDPIDSFDYLEAYKKNGNGFTKILSTFRSDETMAVENVDAFLSYLRN
jgi:glucuronate isomerase